MRLGAGAGDGSGSGCGFDACTHLLVRDPSVASASRGAIDAAFIARFKRSGIPAVGTSFLRCVLYTGPHTIAFAW